MEQKKRDPFLDCTRALAIILVVAGHFAQQRAPDFDDSLPFRLIYSFHMPAFMFISGMSSAFWFERFLATPGVDAGRLVVQDLRAKILRLLVPFTVWGAIAYLLGGRGSNPWQYAAQLLVAPDNGLWFLVVLFQCTLILYLIAGGVRLLRFLPTWLAVVLIGLVVDQVLVRLLPSEYGGFWTKALLPYFVIGLLFYNRSRARMPVWAPLVALTLFEALIPFWHRLHPPDGLVGVPFEHSLNSLFGFVLALSGTVALLGVARFVANTAPERALRWITFAGQRSLDIYAMHLYFMGAWPPVVGPIIVSLAYSAALRVFRLSSLIFFGDRVGNANIQLDVRSKAG